MHWTIPVDPSSLSLSEDGRSVELSISNLQVIDAPKFPLPGPVDPAIVSYTMRWTAVGDEQFVSNSDMRYRFRFLPAQAQIQFSASIPSTGFSYTSDPIETSQSVFAAFGYDSNGAYFDESVQGPANA